MRSFHGIPSVERPPSCRVCGYSPKKHIPIVNTRRAVPAVSAERDRGEGDEADERAGEVFESSLVAERSLSNFWYSRSRLLQCFVVGLLFFILPFFHSALDSTFN